jgi:hypothetical protein
MANIVEIEVDGTLNRSLFFRPLQETVRGRMDWNRGERRLRDLGDKFDGRPLPGQVIGFDVDKGEGFVREPLHAAEHAAARAVIEKQGHGLPPERKTHTAPNNPDYNHADTWLWWMNAAVKTGFAKLIRGKFPETFKRVQKNFGAPDPVKTTENNLIALLIGMLSKEQRERFEDAKAELARA